MVGINGYEFIILAILAVVILGPERLPEYASQLARLVREVRRMASGAREQLREEVGPEIDEVDWRKLDPRQYDPRRIIKEALLDDFEDAAQAAKGRPPAARAGSAPAPAPQPPTPASASGAAPVPAAARPPAVKPLERLAPGEPAPFDIEAT
ncbi:MULTISPECIES: Sec-independent protein translocase TatB [unclassified Arthrobacter]|uniref:Sec-independent protein translocase TatB n=1 Tax=unclassified Arthrobacter TaxID=235627 RepID=UPI001D137180|nr:Sec-independent protein translocase TatB [Arthrobacter sp. zg-Y1143]MCC3277800.1 Sec-independent protein translocase TatB [Arthrobacter sp. zg-Y40]MCC9176204.1 Sec-independent protein translocase TatB [Arthrobacter sp. zg-Y750]MDK1327104.1 Sec-independent protein translocase TatB [Arthrobacter sp. zg-Y1143]